MKEQDNIFRNGILIINFAILCILCIAAPLVIMVVSNLPSGYKDVGMFFQIIYRLIYVCICTVLIFFFQCAVYKKLRSRIMGRIIWAVLFMPTVFVGGHSIYGSLPSVRIHAMMDNAELASLPASASDIKVFSWSTPFSGAAFFRFRATQDDIELFLGKSPILKGAEFEKFDQDDPEHFIHEKSAPPWYTEEIKGPGIQYKVRPKRYPHGVEIIIDEEQSLVFVTIDFD